MLNKDIKLFSFLPTQEILTMKWEMLIFFFFFFFGHVHLSVCSVSTPQ